MRQKNKQYVNTKPISIGKPKIKRVVLSGKDSFKYFIGYKNKTNAVPFSVPLYIKLLQMYAFAGYF